MDKTILITGSTDGIGLETAKLFAKEGHRVLLHGRNAEKLAAVEKGLFALTAGVSAASYTADMSRIEDVEELVRAVFEANEKVDILINNAGVLKVPDPITTEGLDVRFVVNTIAPYLLTKRLMPSMPPGGRVINLSSAAQASVNLGAMNGQVRLSDMDAYAQSKLAIMMWSNVMARDADGVVVVAVNPGSLLASKMVKEGFGVAGSDLSVGAEILVRASLSEEFSTSSGKYFDNDSGQFAPPHADALDESKSSAVVTEIESILSQLIR